MKYKWIVFITKNKRIQPAFVYCMLYILPLKTNSLAIFLLPSYGYYVNNNRIY